MSAEVLAGDLGFDLYVIDLSTVVDKYIGETEKNLDRIFTEADRVNGVLLFDEADALFGKRSEVKDARDRYANVEVAYLLQRMESFDGLAILTTNLRANVDEAFIRRLDAIVDFPLPEDEHRLLLWERNLPARGPEGRRHRPRLPRPPVQALRRRHPQHLRRGGVPRGGRGPPGLDGRPDPRDRARIPEARPAHGRGRVRAVHEPHAVGRMSGRGALVARSGKTGSRRRRGPCRGAAGDRCSGHQRRT